MLYVLKKEKTLSLFFLCIDSQMKVIYFLGNAIHIMGFIEEPFTILLDNKEMQQIKGCLSVCPAGSFHEAKRFMD